MEELSENICKSDDEWSMFAKVFKFYFFKEKSKIFFLKSLFSNWNFPCNYVSYSYDKLHNELKMALDKS